MVIWLKFYIDQHQDFCLHDNMQALSTKKKRYRCTIFQLFFLQLENAPYFKTSKNSARISTTKELLHSSSALSCLMSFSSLTLFSFLLLLCLLLPPLGDLLLDLSLLLLLLSLPLRLSALLSERWSREL